MNAKTPDGESPALSDLKVLDIGTLFAGPGIATLFGDFGAEVIKVEHPKGDSLRNLGYAKKGVPLWWKVISRNKKCITLDLSKPKGQEILRKLIKTTDVLIEAFRPLTMERWNLGYSELSEINRRLIMVRVSGFGQYGPYSNKPGFGTLAESISGFAHVTGFPEGPPTLPPLALADSICSMMGAYATMVALHHRDRTGKGQFIDLSVYEPIFSVLSSQVIDYDQLGIVATRTGNRLPLTAPRNAYRTKDGKWVAISGSAQSVTERIFKAIGRPELVSDPRFGNNRSRLEHIEELDKIIGEWLSAHTAKEAIERFDEVEAAIASIYSIEDIMRDPHFEIREDIVEVDDVELRKIKMHGIFPKLSETPGKIRWPGPEIGEHNKEIYIERLGFPEAKLGQLKSEGVI